MGSSEHSAGPHQRLPRAQLLRRQELALLTPLQRVLNGLCCGLYGYCSLLRAIRLHTEIKVRCSRLDVHYLQQEIRQTNVNASFKSPCQDTE